MFDIVKYFLNREKNHVVNLGSYLVNVTFLQYCIQKVKFLQLKIFINTIHLPLFHISCKNVGVCDRKAKNMSKICNFRK